MIRIAFDDTTEIKLTHPVTGEILIDSKGKTPVAVIYGTHTPQFKNTAREISKARSESDGDIESIVGTNFELYAACVKEFKDLNLETEGGVIDSSDILGTLKSVFWIFEQVRDSVVNRGLFIEKPKKH